MSLFGKTRLARALFLWAILVFHIQPATALGTPNEQSVRAAMVFNFLKFTEFPAERIADAEEIRLCIAIRDSLQEEALTALSGRKIWGRELIVVRLSGRGDICHVLYIDSRQRWSALEDQRILRRALTISAYPGFALDGGMIEIAFQEDAARFDINLAEGRRAGFRFAPQLLRLARRVHD